jgi:predicted alpha/beta hydrolase
MKYDRRRTEGIRWDRWHRMAMMRSLELMVLNGVVRRAEVDPPQHFANRADSEAVPRASLPSLPLVQLDEQGWFTRFFRRRADAPFTHVRHTT